MPKPAKSKAPASVQPVGGYHSKAATHDPCCIPVTVPPLLGNGKDSASGPAPAATHHIANPTAH